MRNSFGAKGVLDRFEPARLIVKVAQIVADEGDEPNALADLRDADVLAGEDVAEIYRPPLEADPPALRHGERLERFT